MAKSILTKLFPFENNNKPNLLAKTLYVVFNDRFDLQSCKLIKYGSDNHIKLKQNLIINRG
ncbi:hypothetical protein L3V83_15095 [Thiotrichales bacterium 19X7-9]|nr:hypothetical protein [Thiotrichales bacterium 19X7-9]